jgi:hypothetical protein
MRQYRLKHFCINKYNLSEASTPTRGGDIFGKNSPNGHRFDSLGLNLTFEDYCWGEPKAKGSSSCPHELGPNQQRVFTGPSSASRYTFSFCKDFPPGPQDGALTTSSGSRVEGLEQATERSLF